MHAADARWSGLPFIAIDGLPIPNFNRGVVASARKPNFNTRADSDRPPRPALLLRDIGVESFHSITVSEQKLFPLSYPGFSIVFFWCWQVPDVFSGLGARTSWSNCQSRSLRRQFDHDVLARRHVGRFCASSLVGRFGASSRALQRREDHKLEVSWVESMFR